MMNSADKAHRMLTRWGAEKLDERRRNDLEVAKERGEEDRVEKLEAMIDFESVSVEFNVQDEHAYSEYTIDPAIQEVLVTGQNFEGEYFMWASDLGEISFFDIIKEMVELADAIH